MGSISSAPHQTKPKKKLTDQIMQTWEEKKNIVKEKSTRETH
jgi:hypothetical protein